MIDKIGESISKRVKCLLVGTLKARRDRRVLLEEDEMGTWVG